MKTSHGDDRRDSTGTAGDGKASDRKREEVKEEAARDEDMKAMTKERVCCSSSDGCGSSTRS